jgi:hypothetical protein
MRPGARLLALTAVCLVATASVAAHVRLIHPGTQRPLFWEKPQRIKVVINSAGTPDLPDGSHETAIRQAIDEWNTVSGTTAQLVENTDPAQQARTDWSSTGIHLVLFDDDNSSGYFPPFSQTVAVTPVWFYGSGTISDADILFNDKFGFTTSGQFLRFDVQDVAAHELGHLLGLDHSGWAGATMYPYVDPTVIEHRSVSRDEVHALRDCYPAAAFGQITGKVERKSNGKKVSGAHVVARDAAGRTVTSILSYPDGTFTLVGLEPGAYTVYAVPLDAPVDEGNLGSGYSGEIQVNFAPTFYPGQAVITGTETIALGDLEVEDDVLLNLGRAADRYPMRAIDGETRTVTLRGTGLFPGSTLTASDPDLILGNPTWFGSQVSFQLTVPDGELPGHVDVQVSNSLGELAVLTAAIEITPPSPVVTFVSPPIGGLSGGMPVAITGSHFNPGARVVIGDQIYTDGVGGTSVNGSGQITLTTRPTIEGIHDVVVIDPTGEEGRMAQGFEAAAIPTVTAVFPVSGDQLGGTEVTLSGFDFQAGMLVRVNGVDQGVVTIVSSNVLAFTTTPGVLGVQTVTVENPGGAMATSVFVYTAAADPALTLVDPGRGKKKGGQLIQVTGANFTADTDIVFDVDPDTGVGGVSAASVTLLSSSMLEVVTPAFPNKGTICVMATNSSTGQANVLEAAFIVKKSDGGGGCYTRSIRGPVGPRDVLISSWWLAAVLLVLLARGRQARPALHA